MKSIFGAKSKVSSRPEALSLLAWPGLSVTKGLPALLLIIAGIEQSMPFWPFFRGLAEGLWEVQWMHGEGQLNYEEKLTVI